MKKMSHRGLSRMRRGIMKLIILSQRFVQGPLRGKGNA